MFRLVSASAICLLACVSAAAGLGPPQSNYIRTRFSTDQGLYSDIVDDIVQSHDGFLWLRVNGVDLDRFDGQHFESPNGVGRVGSLAVAPNGDLWVGTSDDLKQIPADELNQLDHWQPVSHPLGHGLEIVVLHFTRDGVLWVGTNRGLYRFENGVFSPAIPGPHIERIEEAGSGHLWIVTPQGPLEWDGSKAVPHPELAVRLGVEAPEIFDVLEDSKGVTWFCTKDGVARLVAGTLEKLKPYGPQGHAMFAVYEDPRGRMWFRGNEGMFQLTAAGLQLVAPDLKVRRMYGDRDGNLWVSTNGQGLFRFKDLHVQTFTTADGLPNDVAMTVLATHDGSVWTGFNCGGVAHFDGHGLRIYDEKDGLLNSCVWSLAEDTQHDIWVGTWGGGVFRFHEGRFSQYSKAQGLAEDVVRSVAAARDGSVWLAGNGSVSRIRDGRIRNYTVADGLPRASYSGVYADRQGGIWVLLDKETERLVGDRFEPFFLPGKIRGPYVGEDSAGGLYFSARGPQGSLGIFRLVNNQAIQVAPGIGAQELRETKQGDFWLFSASGILRIPPGALGHPYSKDEPLDFEPFGKADGMPSNFDSAGVPTSTLTPDGDLWIATNQGLAVVDLPRLPRTDRKPTIYLEKVTVGRNSQTPRHELVLPAGTHHLEIYFDAIDITAPESIRLQYRLDGVDSEWLDANPPGHAVYSTLLPGKHALHIRACNGNGIWDRVGMVYNITQKPYLYQAAWFRLSCAAGFMLLLWTLYQRRVRSIEERYSERKQAEEKLRQSEDELRQLIDVIPQQVFVFGEDWSPLFANRRELEYTGLTPEKAQSKDAVARIFHPEDFKKLEDLRERARQRNDPFEMEARIKGKNGEYRWFLIRDNPLRDEQGRTIRWYGTRTDIEERKQTEEKLRQAHAELARVARVVTMGELAASIAHEVNQPISGMVMNGNACLRWLAGDSPNLDEARENARRIVRDGKRAGEVIARVRALATKTATEKVRLDTNELTREVIALAQSEAHRNGVTLRTEFASDLWPVLGDRVELQQVVLNLVMNGVESMRTVGNRPRELVIRTQNDEADKVRVTVQDSGIGLDPKSVERIFEAFYTTKQGGMGMGLSISRSIVEHHGGRLWAVANDGPGTTFQFTVPKYH